jgi:hypothetical protein
MGGKAKSESEKLIEGMDDLAAKLLGRVEGIEGLDGQLAVFEQVRCWIAVRHHVGDAEDHRGALQKLKSRVQGNRPAHLTNTHQRSASAARWGKEDPALQAGNGGAALDALKAKLPGFSSLGGEPLRE